MLKINVLEMLYKRSPMNFYARLGDETIIKSIDITTLGYKFDKDFTEEDIKLAWYEVRLSKRISTILIFLLLILLLYGLVFPNFSHLVNYPWYINTIIILAVVGFSCQIITKICTFFFEKRLMNKFGTFEKAIFPEKISTDSVYYKLFKKELVKAFVLISLIVVLAQIGSPFKSTRTLIENEKYNEVIKLTSVGARVFPIAQEWYSLRGYARFQIGDYEGAIKDYDKAYKLGADGFNIMNFDNKIFIKYFLSEYDSALADFDTEIENSGNNDEKDQFMWDKAQFLYHIKSYEEALALYNELIDNASRDRIFLLKDRLYLERAYVYKALGEEELAQIDILNSGADESLGNPIPQPTLILNDF